MSVRPETGVQDRQDLQDLDADTVYARSFSRNQGILTGGEQERLGASTVAIAGLGGIGGNVAVMLARLGVGGFRLADFDRFELANINRQYGASTETVGRLKVEVIAEEIHRINPLARIEVFPEGFTDTTADGLFRGADVAIDAVDFYSITTHVALHQKTREHGLFTLMGSPIGFSACLQVFDPEGMGLEEYCGIEPDMDPLEMQMRYACGIVPELAQIEYYDVSRPESNTDFSAGTGPSLSCACGLAASLVATETAILLLDRRHVRSIPHTTQFDPVMYRYAKTFIPGGMRNYDPAPVIRRLENSPGSLVPQVLDHLFGKPKQPRADINGAKLFWRSETADGVDPAQAPVIVLLSPLGGDSSFWARQVAPFRQAGYRVITFDARGTGISTPSPDGTSVQLLADDLIELLESTGIGPAHLAGVALGAAVAAEVAARRPDLVTGLVLTSAYAQADEQIQQTTAAWRELARTRGMEELLETCLEHLFTPGYIDDNRIALDKLKTFFRLTTQDPDSFCQLSLAGVRYDAGPALATITCPTLVLHGAKDTLVSVQLAEDVAARVPGAELTVVPESAHFLPFEQADAFNEAVLAFLGRLVPRPD
ncbi:alpha/beta fold hydrolase [Kineosporia sp. NBRC 101731]|uniref:alpha/beta fold hydrolase n=1 Tax=Kineosporia sp. NBRC 101731 TaxID=3032199 RepID=UPI0024A39C9E|nr:alpha/beta fold hydrolase [Kineosporia sp. NBRC 101731]GLY30458.1 hypothetical protein Kisp02_38230 [Kineosporia sp. NBRC 101731]